MKTIITPTEGTAPRHVCAHGYLAVHQSESEVVLYELDMFNDSALSKAPEDMSLIVQRDLGIISQAELKAKEPGEAMRRAQHRLEVARARAAELHAEIEKQAAELEAME